MKRCGLTITLAVLLFAISITPHAQAGGGYSPTEIPGEIVFVPFPVNIVLDGDLSDWQGIPPVRVEKSPMLRTELDDMEFTYALASDVQNLYVMMSKEDWNIVAEQHGADRWNEDSFEFYVNASGNLSATTYTDEIIQINVNAADIGNTDPDALTITGQNSDKVHVRGFVFKTESGWGVEVAIPLTSLMVPVHDMQIGFQAQANCASTKDRDITLIWSNADTNDSSRSDPSVFGRASFFEIGQDTAVPDLGVYDLPQQPEDLLANVGFSEGQDSWWASGNVNLNMDNEHLCATVTHAGAEPEDIIVGQNEVPLIKGQIYTIMFAAQASEKARVNVNVQMEAEPKTLYASHEIYWVWLF